jgi:hypothetical protein
MRMCGRRVNASTDDFSFVSGCSVSGRIVWIGFLAAFLALTQVKGGIGAKECSNGILAYLYVALSVNIVGALLDCLLCYSSGQGSYILRPERLTNEHADLVTFVLILQVP